MIDPRRQRIQLDLTSSEVSAILTAVCAHFDMSRVTLLSGCRLKRIAIARHLAMWLVRAKGYSYPEIGRIFGRDHTTVMSAVRKVDALCSRGDIALEHLARLTVRLGMRLSEVA